MDVPWPEPRAKVDLTKLKAYSFSRDYNLLFCPTCSTPMFFCNTKQPEEELVILSGTLRNDPIDPVKIKHHIFVGDTKDGGASMWLRKPNADGNEVKRYYARPEDDTGKAAEPIPSDWPPPDTLTAYHTKTEGAVPIFCKCKGVSLDWAPGGYDGMKDNELPWFVDPTTHKALGGFCACESCRLPGGCDVWTWGFAELKHISFTDKREGFPDSSTELRAMVDAKDPSLGTLTYYASSSDAQRYFCSNCSATIFYVWDERTFMVDFAIGVLGASEGARAEGNLSWAYGGSISHLEENRGGWRYGLFQRVMKEGEDWRIVRGYPKNWRREAREKALETA